MTNKEYALLAGKVLSDKKGEDVVIIDLQGKATFADYFVICSGGSERQTAALADEIEDRFAENGLELRSAEGRQTAQWILMDFGDIIVNIFTAEAREKYSIEKVWGDCKFIEVEE